MPGLLVLAAALLAGCGATTVSARPAEPTSALPPSAAPAGASADPSVPGTPGAPPGRWGQPPPPPAAVAGETAAPLPWPQPTDATGRPVVYLTFDDGPSVDNTPAVLAALQRFGARATFFVVGQRAWLHPELVRQEVAAGDAVGGHGWRHVRLTALTPEQRRAALGGTQTLLRYLGAPGRCFRPPFGVTDAAVRATARELGLRQYLWTDETRDWTKRPAAVVATTAISGLTPGAILVFHDGHASGGAETVTVVETVLRELARRGWSAQPLPC